MKKNLLALILVLMTGTFLHAQTYSSLSGVNSGNSNWVNLGTFTMSQAGVDGFIRVIGGGGYNASIDQMGYTEIHIRTSNAVSVDANGFAFSATATSVGRGFFISAVHIVPNAAGVNASAYTVYAYCAPYLGNTFYSAEVSPGSGWAPSNTIYAGTPGGYNVPFELVTNNDVLLKGRVGVNVPAMPGGYQFAVNGSAIATSVTVKLYSAWPDYVFKPGFQLPVLEDTKKYINQHGHLPEIPAAEEIAKKGIDLGEMNRLLVKKVEELTLYMIDNNEKNKEKDQLLTTLQHRIAQLEQHNSKHKKHQK
ncbi:hypothetical protein [Mucilaginibacter kameinonensis]|uniref:hypothetical protein n=1 Tax=Mucilaginibacter kameinonensis TaxID=452286 RepID=UPI000EF79B76|nr:hypothetical protein [Mucilaginibacter kameinonensis]